MVLRRFAEWFGQLKEATLIWWRGTSKYSTAVPDTVVKVLSADHELLQFHFQPLFDVAALEQERKLLQELMTDDEDEDEEEFFDPVGNLEDWV
ncbi:unnamed protein product [Allacma fusca]|uniref:Uncharacterized protein n=1 Tax=Allacma fusca TaxID=39272 RepID=A0A8J2J4X3_9HEXA|nr:unnamed protein product [Allacma fusca]